MEHYDEQPEATQPYEPSGAGEAAAEAGQPNYVTDITEGRVYTADVVAAPGRGSEHDLPLEGQEMEQAGEEAVETEAGTEVAEAAELEEEHGPPMVDLTPAIPTNGQEDAYEEFDDIMTRDVRDRVAQAAEDLLREVAPDLDHEDVLVSCFGDEYDPDAMRQTDAHKLGVTSRVPLGGFLDAPTPGEARGYRGDDVNLGNVAERDIQELRDERGKIGQRMNLLLAEEGSIPESVRQAAKAEVDAINAQIQALQDARPAVPDLPVYYATPLDGLRQSVAEDNPLGYAGTLPGKAYLAFYDGAAMRADGVMITEKTTEQLRIAATGVTLMQYCRAVLRVSFEDREEEG
jgi:hypothetical protein